MLVETAIIGGLVLYGVGTQFYLAREPARELKVAHITDAIEWSSVDPYNPTIVHNENGTGFMVLALQGPRYSALAENIKADILARRKQWFLADLAGQPVTAQFRTLHTSSEGMDQPEGEGVLADMNRRWGEALTHTFETSHYLVLTAHNERATVETLPNIADAFIQKCPEFNPTPLSMDADETGYSPLGAYLFELANGVKRPIKPIYTDLAECLSVSQVEALPSGPIRQSRNIRDLCMIPIVVVSFGENTDSGVLSALMALPFDFEYVVTTEAQDKSTAQNHTRYRAAQAKVRYSNPIVNKQFTDTETDVHAELDTLTNSHIAIYPRAASLDELEHAATAIIRTLASSGWSVVEEGVLALRAFMSRWPGNRFMDRPRHLTASNIVDLTPASTGAKGNSASIWGPVPARKFPTAGESSTYAFTFQATADDDDSPHGIIFAPTRGGKTTFETFCASGAHAAYPELRQLYFDYRYGLRSFTAFHDGQYLGAAQGSDMQGIAFNPFDVPDTPDARALQVSLLQAMTRLTDPDASQVLSKAVEHAAANAPNLSDPITLERFWENYILDPRVKNALAPWVKNERYSAIFGSKHDAFDPYAARITTVALDQVLDDPHLAGVFAYYIMSRIQNGFVANGLPYRIVIDEASTILSDSNIASMVMSEARTAGKNKGQVTTIWQDFHSQRKNAEGDALVKNAGTLYLWPGVAQDEDECRQIGKFQFMESERKFLIGAWRPKGSVRPVLVKREDEGVFLETNLAGLGPYLRIFKGGNDHNKELAKCMIDYPKDWRRRFVSPDA